MVKKKMVTLPKITTASVNDDATFVTISTTGTGSDVGIVNAIKLELENGISSLLRKANNSMFQSPETPPRRKPKAKAKAKKPSTIMKRKAEWDF